MIGGGPAGLMAAEVLSGAGLSVTVYERMPSLGRKFLLAGRGGLNLTHSEDFERLIGRYGAAAGSLRPAIEAFAPSALRAWCEARGQETFVGSSGRVFPRAMKASPLLRAWLARLDGAGVTFRLRHLWTGWDDAGRLLFETPTGGVAVEADASVLALGGASWPRLGSDGGWAFLLARHGVEIVPIEAANCGVLVPWSTVFRERFAGQPLKRLEVSCAGQSARGEAIVTATGLEGGVVYALSAAVRDALKHNGGSAELAIDLRPDVAASALEGKLSAPRGKQSLATFLRKAVSLSPPEIGLLYEAALSLPGGLAAQSPASLAAVMKAIPTEVTGLAPIERAISTAGGIAFAAIDDGYMLRKRPGVFVAGEMLDWEAPTGGYLLQACFATGAAAGRGVLAWLDSDGN